jgi:hypothetical protein
VCCAATSVTIVGNFSKALSIIAGYVVFNTTLSALQLLGLVVCMGGTLWYSIEARRAKEDADAAAAKKKEAGELTALRAAVDLDPYINWLVSFTFCILTLSPSAYVRSRLL